ncbi:MAG TPA: hypothetical protein VGR53_06805 [Nitrososphaerales archaeon]|nr:hypothetical protein [Nitrososphaerales archaeon]
MPVTGLELLFEWGGSFAIGRPLPEILIGWNVPAGYMWPFILLAYTFSNLIVGIVIHPGGVGSPTAGHP